MSLEVVTIDPTEPPKASVIWLHGLGADGNDFADIVPQLQLPEDMAVRFIFPHAPVRPIALNMGMPMRAWFDVYDLTTDAKQDETGIRQAQTLVEELIAQEIERGISSENIVLAGFSQGAAMALHCGLRYDKKLAGILVLSGFLMLADRLKKEINLTNKDTSILMMHGSHDNMVPIAWAEHSRDILQELNLPVQWDSFPIEHGVCAEEVTAISNWLQHIL